MGLRHRTLLIVLASSALAGPICAQERRAVVTAADYARAEKFLAPALAGLVVGGSVAAQWTADDRFSYRTTLADGSAQTILVDPVKKTRTVCTADCPAAPPTPPPGAFAARAASSAQASSDGKPLALSPDGTRGAFVRDWNLWIRDIASGKEQAVTTDGVEYFGYATDNAGWSSSDRAILLWSPDSRKIATQQQDERNVGEMYLVNTTVGHPTLRVSKFPLPGDPVMAMVHRVVIDVASGRITRPKRTSCSRKS